MSRAALREGLAALALAAAATAGLPAAASAHVTISPTASRPGDLQRYRLLVPNESTGGHPTTGVDVQLPKGVTFALVDAQPPWRATLVRRGSDITQIRWRGGDIPVDGYGELYFLARNPVRQGTMTFKVVQRYAGGEIVRWIGSPDSDHPSPTVRVTEGAQPQDVVSVHGEGAPAAPTTARTSRPAIAADTKTDTIALVVSLVGVVLSGIAVARTVRRAPT